MHKVQVEQEAVGLTERANEAGQEPVPAEIKFATFRRGAGTFFREFPMFRESLRIRQLVGMTQSESDGNLTLTIAYR